MKRLCVALIILFSFFGLADSLYLAQQEASAAPLICNIGSLSDCNVVASSEYSKILGIPVAELGVFFYGVLFVLALLELFLFEHVVRRVIQVLSVIGLLVSIYSTFIQVYVINALCVYCIASAVTSLLIFIAAVKIEPIRFNRKMFQSETRPPPPPFLSMPPAS